MRLARSLIGGAALAVSVCAAAGGGPAAPPRLDPAVVLARELRQALDADSNGALILFIGRHPDEAAEARARLAARRTPDPGPVGGADAEILAAFDAARLAGTREALAAFARRFPNHPLAAEAARPFWLRPDGRGEP